MSIDKCIDKEDVVHITMEYYSALKKNEIMPFAATLMNLEIIKLSEVSQTERQMPYDITYMWNLKYDTNELIYKTETDYKHGKQTYHYQRGWGGER